MNNLYSIAYATYIHSKEDKEKMIEILKRMQEESQNLGEPDVQ